MKTKKAQRFSLGLLFMNESFGSGALAADAA